MDSVGEGEGGMIWENGIETPPGSQASSRGEAKDSALLSSRDAGLLEPPEEDPSGCGAASPSQGRWDPDSLRPALSLGCYGLVTCFGQWDIMECDC